jgi:hypothetical protein
MPPAAGTPPAQNNAELLTAISGLKDDLTKELDTRFAAYDEKLGKVEHVDDILTEARKNQEAEIAARREAQQRAEGYKPTTYQQIRDDAVKIALDQMKADQKKEQDKINREQDKMSAEERELDQQLDQDMNKLEKVGYLPPQYNEHDYNDPGVAARRELLSYAAYLETPNLGAVADTLASLHRSDERWDPDKRAIVSANDYMLPLPGKNAPVGNSSVTSGNTPFSGPTAHELRTMSMSQLSELPKTRGYGPTPVASSSETGF